MYNKKRTLNGICYRNCLVSKETAHYLRFRSIVRCIFLFNIYNDKLKFIRLLVIASVNTVRKLSPCQSYPCNRYLF